MPLSDRGFAYGDGLFETMRAIGSNIALWAFHERRLLSGCKRLGIRLDPIALTRQLNQIFDELSSKQSLIKIIVTRAGPSAGYAPPAQAGQPNIYIRLSPCRLVDAQKPSVEARICAIRLSRQPVLAGIKHLNRLEQVLAAREIGHRDMEGILMDTEGYIIEAISSNLIAVADEIMYIPDLGSSGVRGVMQAYIEDLASSEGFKIKTARIKLEEFIQAPEILVCNSIRGIRNISGIEGLWKSRSEKTGAYLRHLLLDRLNDQFYSY